MFNFKKLSLLSLVFLALTFFVTSCDKDNLQESITPMAEATVEARLGAALIQGLPPTSQSSTDSTCFQFNFPLSFVQTDGTVFTFEDENTLYDASEDGSNDLADFVYPFTVTLTDGTASTITSLDDLMLVIADCVGDFEPGDWEDEGEGDDGHVECPDGFDFEAECFTQVFPVTVSVDGVETTIADSTALEAFLADLDLDAPLDFELVLPFSVQLTGSGEIVEVNNEEELFDLLSYCDSQVFEGDDDGEVVTGGTFCFDFNFPYSIILDGEVVEVADDEALDAALSNDDGTFEGFAFPLSVTLAADGQVVTLNSIEELEQLTIDCN